MKVCPCCEVGEVKVEYSCSKVPEDRSGMCLECFEVLVGFDDPELTEVVVLK